ncbi:hypothetical protein KP509_02G006900 [Ceratopteris richardii]|uniref:Uncharacterized protein n=1 Tax=Ceratopteris richardii TaxID=49495 RepID=A0A8T2VAX1_CERRI|nr:hypothetical protein KP509_02G006900 [Ceratopteris richardii]
MGNCVHGIAGEAASRAAVLEYPSGRHEFVAGGTITAHQVMLRNPGFYVAKMSPPSSSSSMAATMGRCTGQLEVNSSPVCRRSSAAHNRIPCLLPADAPLCVGCHYRLLTFEEAFYQFAKANRVDYMFSPNLKPISRTQPPTTAEQERYMSTLQLRSCFSSYSENKQRASKGSKPKDMQRRILKSVILSRLPYLFNFH